MNKQLLEQVQQALKAQQNTIQRQERMLNDKDRDIAELQNLLKQLTLTQIEELERLPSLYENLKNTINEQKKAYSGWVTQRKTQLELMNSLSKDTIELCNAQIQLIKLMKDYQSTIALENTLSSDTEQLESKLSELQETQNKINSTQNEISKSQQLIQTELDSLNSLINK